MDGRLPKPKRREDPVAVVAGGRPKQDPAGQLAGWTSFIAWLSWLIAATLTDSTRAGFRVVGGIDRMFGVYRPSHGSAATLRNATLLAAVGFVVAIVGLVGTARMRRLETKMPWHLLLAATATGAMLFYLVAR